MKFRDRVLNIIIMCLFKGALRTAEMSTLGLIGCYKLGPVDQLVADLTFRARADCKTK